MVNHSLTRKLWRDLWQRRGTILALILILAVGVCCYVGMAGVYQDLDCACARYYQQYHLADFTLDLKRAPTAVLPRLTNVPNVRRLQARIKMDTMLNLSPQVGVQPTHLIPGVVLSLPGTPSQSQVNQVRLVSGTWFSNPYAKEMLLSEKFANAHHIIIGQRINVRFLDEVRPILVVGFVTSPEFTLSLAPDTLAPDPGGFGVAYMPFPLLQQYADLNGSFNQLIGLLKNNSPIATQNTMDLLAHPLEPYGVLLKTAQADQMSVQILHDELLNIKKSVTVFPSIFFLVAMLVLNMMVGRLVTHQRNAIGILKALGYNNASLFRHYLSFGGLIGLGGGILGAILGFGLQHLFLKQYNAYFAIPNMTLHPYWHIFIIGILISTCSALLGAIAGTFRATRLAPAEAIRPPPPEKSTHVLLERWQSLWHRFSFQNKMVVRAIVRNPFRSSVTVIAAILSTMLVFSAFEFLDSMYEMVYFAFDQVQHQDYTLTLREPLGNKILTTVAHLPGVKKIETQLSVPATFQNGSYRKDVGIIGLPTHNVLYTPIDRFEHPIHTTASGIVINQTLANILHVAAGDFLTIRPLIGNRTPSRVKITRIIRTYLGLSAYTDQAWLSRLLGNSFVSNQILFQLQPHADVSAFTKGVGQFFPVTNLMAAQRAKDLFLDTLYEFMIFTTIIMIIFAGIIAMGAILNTAMISFNERERDVASLRVLGFSTHETAKIFFQESLWLNILGIGLGLIAGIYFVYYLSFVFSTEIYRMPVVIHQARLFESVLIMLAFVLTAQAMIYRMIKKLNFLSVLNIGE